MSERITYEQAATILGCHVSNVAKLIRKGHLTSTGRRGASLDRGEVERLRDQRAQTPPPTPPRPSVDHRPDTVHDWLSPAHVATLLGVTPQAVRQRIHRGRLPAAENGGRLWVRRDHLEQVEAARLVAKTRRP